MIQWSHAKGERVKLHTKQSGNLGELIIAADLTRQGYYVFKELGDICKSDLIVLDKDYVPIKIQVKCLNTVNGAIMLKSSKSGPNYHFRYEIKHADVYAVYVQDKNTILYISNTELLEYKTLTIRIENTKNNQTKKVNKSENYSDFKRVLRDYTRTIPLTKIKDDDIVQPAIEIVNEN